jgi:hypothetical protein
MCTPCVTTPKSAHAERSIENTYAPYDTGPDAESEEVGTSTSVRGSRPSVRSAPPGARYTSYHSERQHEPPITSANAPLPLLAFARQRSSVSASACVRAAGKPEARTGAKAMYGGGDGASSFVVVVSSELAVVGMSQASG